MNYAQIREMDISNGEQIGVSIYCSGCRNYCKNCFNEDIWDFNSGEPFTSSVKETLFELANKPYIKRLSVLGGEPLDINNINEVQNLIKEFKQLHPNKSVWVYTGYTIEELGDLYPKYLSELLSNIDVLVDGRYIDELRDLTLPFRGSLNQRILDIQETLKQKKLVLREDLMKGKYVQ